MPDAAQEAEKISGGPLRVPLWWAFAGQVWICVALACYVLLVLPQQAAPVLISETCYDCLEERVILQVKIGRLTVYYGQAPKCPGDTLTFVNPESKAWEQQLRAAYLEAPSSCPHRYIQTAGGRSEFESFFRLTWICDTRENPVESSGERLMRENIAARRDLLYDIAEQLDPETARRLLRAMHAHPERTQKYGDAEKEAVTTYPEMGLRNQHDLPAVTPDPIWLAAWLQKYFSEELKEPPPPPEK